MSRETLLDVKDLSVRFQTDRATVDAVKNLSFSLNRGESLGIVGESGSGKSVTSLAIMGLLPKRTASFPSGEMLFSSRLKGQVNLLADERLPEAFRGDEIGMIFQEPMTALNPVYTCGSQLLEVLEKKGFKGKEAKNKAVELFRDVELPRPEKIYESYPHQISGGQKQRVMIAMCLAMDPLLLIADEPTTALDVTVQKEIILLLDKLKKQHGTAVIFITHDLGLISEVADKTLVMYRGDQLEFGETRDVFLNPKHPYTKGLVACKPTLQTEKKRLLTVSDYMEEGADGTFKELVPEAQLSLPHYSEENEVILRVEDLVTRYALEKSLFGKTTKYLHAVDHVSIEVRKGETLGLVGESGCGKSTLGRSIMGLNNDCLGSILYEGKDILKMSTKELDLLRTDIQYIFQDPYASLNPRMLIKDILMEPMTINKVLDSQEERKEKAIELLETVGLTEEALMKYPHEFSGGQRQRICVARTLALQPKIVICDESVSALDVSVQAQVLNLLNDLKEKFKFTYIFISHDLSVVKYMADRLVVMKEGKIVESGDPEQIYKNPKEDYTKRLIASIPKGIAS